MPEDGSTIPALVGLPLVVVLLLANAIFVATEFALVTVRRTRIDQLAAEGQGSAKRVKKALGNLDYYIAAAQLGITMASIALGFFGEPVLARYIEPPVEAIVGSFAPTVSHSVALLVAFGFVTALHIIFGEFVPKTIALEQSERTSLAIALPLDIFVRIFSPFIWALNHIANSLLRLLGMDIRPLGDNPLTAEDLALTVESSATAGLISRRELSLTRHLLLLSRIEGRELMVPRSRMVTLDVESSWNEVAGILAERPLTRYPVTGESIDNIIGILDAKRLLLDEDETARLRWQEFVKPALIVPETVSANTTLETIRRNKAKMAILVDEYGGTAGLITVFDIVRFLAEDLPGDEESIDRQVVTWDGATPIMLDGLAPLSEVIAALGIEDPDIDAATLGGFVTELRRNIPSEGDTVHYEDIAFHVLEMDQYRVAKVRVEPRTPGSVDDAAGWEHAR
jgi:CBS domain containing-hemolysin-like protein